MSPRRCTSLWKLIREIADKAEKKNKKASWIRYHLHHKEPQVIDRQSLRLIKRLMIAARAARGLETMQIKMKEQKERTIMSHQNADIIPKVNGSVTRLEGRFVMPGEYRIEGGFTSSDRVFTERMKRIGHYVQTGLGKPVISFARDGALPGEAYQLRILEESVQIRAKDEQGYRWALTTFYQLLAEGDGNINCCVIRDKPRWQYRGIMLDVCRHFYNTEEVKKIIEQLSLLKMNVFHWHLSDDQGFRIESRNFPRLNEIGSYRQLSPQDPMVEEGKAKSLDSYGGFYTQDEIRDVVSFAAERGVEVIPEIDLPGHSSAILAAYPEYTCTGKPLKVKNTFGVHDQIFCAGKEETYSFLEALLDEVMGLFPSSYFHIGGDEAPKEAWHDCPFCNRKMKAHGLENYEQLQAYFTGRLIAHLKERGKTPIVWNESAASGKLDPAAVVQYWSEMAPGESYMIPELKKGRSMILSDGDRLYISSGYAEMPMKSTLLYEPNVKGIPVPDANVRGIEAPVWTEWICTGEELEQMMYPRLLAVAELGWTKKKDMDDFLRRAKTFLSCPALNVLKPMPWEKATVHGEEAVRQVVQALLSMGARYAGMTTGEEDEAPARVEAVMPDGTGEIDMEAMTRAFVTNKMQAAYSKEEMEEAIRMISDVMDSNRGEKQAWPSFRK